MGVREKNVIRSCLEVGRNTHSVNQQTAMKNVSISKKHRGFSIARLDYQEGIHFKFLAFHFFHGFCGKEYDHPTVQ